MGVQQQCRYSEGFKVQVVREMEEGKLATCRAASERYGIKGKGTVRSWLLRYGKSQLIGRVTRVETPEEQDEMRRLKERVRRLEQALSDAHLDLRLERAYVNLACRAAGIEDVDSFKKNSGGQPSTKLEKKVGE